MIFIIYKISVFIVLEYSAFDGVMNSIDAAGENLSTVVETFYLRI